MSKLTYALALFCCCCFIACDGGDSNPNGKTDTLTLHAKEDNSDKLNYCDADGNCEDLPNPNHCAVLVITIDTITGKTCERCENEKGVGIERCGDTSVACEVVSLPDPDCVVCAYINGAVVYSSCNPPDPDHCAAVACPAIYPVCPGGQEPRRDPTDCCGFTCPPNACDDVYCASFAGCPEGTDKVIEPPDCCGTCVPKSCSGDTDCPKSWHCEQSDPIVCLPCNAPKGAACTDVCRPAGTCQRDYAID